jgi:ATP-dependent phosphofructokinase / diphosphate-dependent phosphofructokinase
LNQDGTFIAINDTELSWLGYTREEVVGKMSFSQIIAQDNVEKFEREFERFKQSDEIKNIEFDIIRKDGTHFPVVLNASAIRDADGNFLADAGTTDAFGHKQLGGVGPVIAAMVKSELGFKYHWAVADYLQRSARHIASQTDLEQAWAVGEAAVEMALAGRNSVMATIERLSDDPYEWRIGEAPLDEVANVEKKMPPEFITDDGFGITEAARRYLAPLIQGEAYPPYEAGMPRYVRLKNAAVPRKLDTEFKLK